MQERTKLENEAKSLAASTSQKYKGEVLPLEEWRLSSLIDTACNLRLINTSVKALSHSARELRNLVHPIKEIKENYKLEKEEAEIVFKILEMLIRDLKK